MFCLHFSMYMLFLLNKYYFLSDKIFVPILYLHILVVGFCSNLVLFKFGNVCSVAP